jgi:cytochrome c5
MEYREMAMPIVRTMICALVCGWVLGACANKESATAPPVAAPAVPAVTENTVGKSVYGTVCSICHAAGVGGAPKPGDKADWGPRIAQGMDVLYKHSMEGFTGTKGVMPPHGAMPNLTETQMKSAVDYMVGLSR